MSTFPFRKPPASVLEGKSRPILGTPIHQIDTVLAGIAVVEEYWCGGCGKCWGVSEDRPCRCLSSQCPSCGAIDALNVEEGASFGYCDGGLHAAGGCGRVELTSLGEMVK